VAVLWRVERGKTRANFFDGCPLTIVSSAAVSAKNVIGRMRHRKEEA